MGDQGVRLLENLIAYDGRVVMLTITAPGADRLPWDTGHCGHDESGRECSGRVGCRVRPAQARAFNEQSLRAWSKLWTSVRTASWRRFGPGALKLLAYSPEMQARGVIHYHLVFGCESAREMAAVRFAGFRLRQKAGGYGWGFVDTNPLAGARASAASAAVYVSKYLTAAGKRESTREMVVAGHAPRRAVYVSAHHLTVTTRCTMRNLRCRRLLYREDGIRRECPEVEVAMRDRAFKALWVQQKRGGCRFAAALVGDDGEPPTW
jgi:hypothetical protein